MFDKFWIKTEKGFNCLTISLFLLVSTCVWNWIGTAGISCFSSADLPTSQDVKKHEFKNQTFDKPLKIQSYF